MADTAATFAGIHNENEFYSQHYLSEIFTGDIRDTLARWRDATEAAGGASTGARTPNEALRALARDYLQFRRRSRASAGTRRASGSSGGGSANSSAPSATSTNPTATSSTTATKCWSSSPGTRSGSTLRACS